MKRLLLLLLCLLAPAWCLAAATPTTLRVVDVRWIAGQPELETWLGCLQGLINRQGGDTAVFVIGNNADAEWADTLVRMYHLKKETLTPGALLELEKKQLTGQVLYDPAQPWTRNVALTAAAVQTGEVIATASDLGVPTVLDLHKRWTDRVSAYTWADEQYRDQVNTQGFTLAPEGGNLLADYIVSTCSLAVDLSPQAQAETDLLKALITRYPAHSRVLGSPDDRTQLITTFPQLDTLLTARNDVLVPARDCANLSCFARFPVTRPLLQQRDEPFITEGKPMVVFLYGAYSRPGGCRSLDYAAGTLFALLHDPALAQVPVGIEVPTALQELAPAMYQTLIARQRQTAVELIAAPATDKLEEYSRKLDLTAMSLLPVTELATCRQMVNAVAQAKWRGALVPPILPEQVTPAFAMLAAKGPLQSIAEIRAALADEKASFQVIALDPADVPPVMLRSLLAEISRTHLLLTPTQAFRALGEASVVAPYLQAQAQQGSRNPLRGKATLKVSTPVTSLAAPTADAAIPVSVHIDGTAPVLMARLLYTTPDGRMGASDLQQDDAGEWTTTLPPMLTGGTLSVRARVVEQGGFGISVSPPLEIAIPSVDSDRDGLEDTMEEYLGADPHRQDTDGDGLPDGLDPDPVHRDRDFAVYTPPITPPADACVLPAAGASSADAQGRVIPAGKSITYHLPLKDLPAAQATVRLCTVGKGTVALNAGKPAPLEALPADGATTDQPLQAVQPLGAEVTVTLTADDKPLRVLSLALISNPDGPYILPVLLTPAIPFAGMPIPVEVTVYDPAGIKTVRLRYGASSAALTTLELKPVEGGGNVLFAGEIPAQTNGASLIYGVEAVDRNGRTAAGPYSAVPIGRTRKHSVALFGSRDMHGAWSPLPVWGNWGRALNQQTGTDTGSFFPRAGAYTAWILASPRERGIAVTITRQLTLRGETLTRLARVVPAGGPDGWYKLGTFNAVGSEQEGEEGSFFLHVNVTPQGEKGYCAYGEVVLTQDEQFTPPLTHASFDWFNKLAFAGITDGQTVKDVIKLRVLAAGNIDTVQVAAQKLPGGAIDTDAHPFDKQVDGSFTLSTRKLVSGTYKITAYGIRLLLDNGQPKPDAFVTQEIRVVVP